ncbi:MAG TPA: hypothetical protein VF531_00470 [Bacillota bacterium]
MITLTLTDQEVNLLEMSIRHCLKTCKQGGPDSGCSDCELLQQVAVKIEKTKTTAPA